jgi:peptidoglycan hydrolase CwlO-like protein
MMMMTHKALFLLFPLIVAGCNDHELMHIKNKEIDTLKAKRIAITAELETMRDSFKDCQTKNKDAHQKIEELNKTIEALKTKQNIHQEEKSPEVD